jgi:hypothetical protein
MSYVFNYARTLASGDALTVRRLGQYCDWDESELADAVDAAAREVNHLAHRVSRGWSTQRELNRMRGIHIALTRAYAEAGERSYRRRQRR